MINHFIRKKILSEYGFQYINISKKKKYIYISKSIIIIIQLMRNHDDVFTL